LGSGTQPTRLPRGTPTGLGKTMEKYKNRRDGKEKSASSLPRSITKAARTSRTAHQREREKCEPTDLAGENRGNRSAKEVHPETATGGECKGTPSRTGGNARNTSRPPGVGKKGNNGAERMNVSDPDAAARSGTPERGKRLGDCLHWQPKEKQRWPRRSAVHQMSRRRRGEKNNWRVSSQLFKRGADEYKRTGSSRGNKSRVLLSAKAHGLDS